MYIFDSVSKQAYIFIKDGVFKLGDFGFASEK